MAEQEFLASYGVDIDEEGVKRLEAILKSNEKMGKSVSSAFNAANKSVNAFIEGMPKDGPEKYAFLKSQAHKDGKFDPAESMRGLAQSLLFGTMADWKDPDDPTNVRSVKDWALQNMETMYIGQATKDTANASKELVSWKDYGLKESPFEIPGFNDLQDKAQELLREPIAKAREYMQQAMDAESEGLDGTEYVDKITDLLEEPFKKVREMYDSFDFGGIGEGGAAGDGVGGVMQELDQAKQGLSDLREDAQRPVEVKGNASQVVSAARSALESVRSLFSETFVLNVRADAGLRNNNKQEEESGKAAFRRSIGGRFSNPTRVEVAEDGGEEYIIPIKKENRALPLIRQMMGELSPDARRSLLDEKESAKADIASAKTDITPVGANPVQTELSKEEGEKESLVNLAEIFKAEKEAPENVQVQPVKEDIENENSFTESVRDSISTEDESIEPDKDNLSEIISGLIKTKSENESSEKKEILSDREVAKPESGPVEKIDLSGLKELNLQNQADEKDDYQGFKKIISKSEDDDNGSETERFITPNRDEMDQSEPEKFMPRSEEKDDHPEFEKILLQSEDKEDRPELEKFVPRSEFDGENRISGLDSLSNSIQAFIGNAGSMGIGSSMRESVSPEVNNVSAPVTINVNASGSDAKRIGRSVYDTAERYLLRTMKGAIA